MRGMRYYLKAFPSERNDLFIHIRVMWMFPNLERRWKIHAFHIFALQRLGLPSAPWSPLGFSNNSNIPGREQNVKTPLGSLRLSSLKWHNISLVCIGVPKATLLGSPRASLVTQMVKNLPAMWETWFWSLGQENPLEKGMAHPVFLPREFHGLYIFHGVTKSWTQLGDFHFHLGGLRNQKRCCIHSYNLLQQKGTD